MSTKQSAAQSALILTAAVGTAVLTGTPVRAQQQQRGNFNPPRQPVIVNPRVTVPQNNGGGNRPSSFGPGAIPMPTVGTIPNPQIRIPAPVGTVRDERYSNNGYRYPNRAGGYYTTAPVYDGYYNNGAYYGNRGYYRNNVTAVVVPGAAITANGITYFGGGYCSSFVTGQTVLSPFGGLYGCAPYIRTTYVLNSPYLYSDGTETVTLPVNDSAAPSTTAWDAVVAADPQPAQPSQYRVRDEAPTTAAVGAERQRVQTLRAALDDLARFWEEDDLHALRRHLDSEGTIAVYEKEKVAYSLRRPDMLAMFEDAQARTETVSFRFTTISRRDDGLVNVYAEHKYRLAGEGKTGGGTPHVATARYTLAYIEGAWFLNAVSFAPGSVSR